MKKAKVKKLLSVLAFVLMLTVSVLSLVACGDDNKSSDDPGGKSGVGVIKTEAQDFSVEADETFVVPNAYLVDSTGQRLEGEVSVTVTNPNGIVVATSVIEIKAKLIGDYIITYAYPNAENVVIKVKSQDTRGPELKLGDVFYNAYKDESVRLPNVEFSDFSEVDNDSAVFKVYYIDGDQREEKQIEQLSNSFVADNTGKYVYHVEVSDVIGNSTVKEWEISVVDKTWMASDATGATIATFDDNGYVNVFGGGTATDMQGNSDVTILDEYEGVTGVAKVVMNYFDHNFGNYSTVNIRFPREYNYVNNKRVALKIYVGEATMLSDNINLMTYEHTHVTGVGVNYISSYYVKAGSWNTIILEGGALQALADGSGIIKGLQLGVKQSASCTDKSAQIFYLASITEITALSTPTGLSESGNAIVWDSVPNATGYLVEDESGNQYTVSNAEFAKPQGAYRIRVKAIGDGAYYEESAFSNKFGNILNAPANLELSNVGLLTWDNVSGATGYVVVVNDQEVYNDTGNSFVFDQPQDKNYVIKVKAKGNGTTNFDSDYTGIGVRYLSLPDGVIADFSDETYVYDVTDVTISNLFGMAAQSYKAEYLEEYQGKSGVLKISVTVDVNGWGVISLKLPKTLILDETLRSMNLTFRLEGVEKGDYLGLRVYGHGQTGEGTAIVPELGSRGVDAWYTVTMPRDLIVSGYRNATESDYMVFGVALMPAEATYYLYLDEITEERWAKLDTPTNLMVENDLLTWDAVEGATGYVVTVNGEKITVTNTSFDLTNYPTYTITIQAINDNAISDYSETVIMNERTRYKPELAAALDTNVLADYSREEYLYFVEENGFDSFTAEIIDDPLDNTASPRKVLHISGSSGYHQIHLVLPKTITDTSVSLEYMISCTPVDPTVLTNGWGIMYSVEMGGLVGWDLGLKPIEDVDAWSYYTVISYQGKDYVTIGINSTMASFDLYIATVYNGSAQAAVKAQYKSELAAALDTNVLADYSREEYLYFVEENGFDSFTAEIIDDPLDNTASPRKVLHISGSSGYHQIHLVLPKTITDTNVTLEYMISCTPVDPTVLTNGWGIMYSVEMGGLVGWDLGLKPIEDVNVWSIYTVGSYQGKDYVTIGINSTMASFDLYIAAVYDGGV